MKRILLGLFCLSVLLGATGARAGCPVVPENDIWGKVGHDKIARYVDEAYKGDWSAYIDKWEGRLKRVSDIAARDSILVFHNAGRWLKGDDLRKYVSDVRARIETTRCLADADRDIRPGEALAGTAMGEGS